MDWTNGQVPAAPHPGGDGCCDTSRLGACLAWIARGNRRCGRV